MLGLLDRFRAVFAGEEMPGGPPILLDADAGTVDGVSLGAPLARVHEVWGPGEPPHTPLHTYRPVGASNMGAPPGKRGGDHIDVLQYPGMLVHVSARAGLYAALVWRSGTRTGRGVGAGDRLARVRTIALTLTQIV
jgi:hypothetical protein